MKLFNKTLLVKGLTNKTTKSGIILATDKYQDQKEVYIGYEILEQSEDCEKKWDKGDRIIMMTPHHSQTWHENLAPNKDLFIIYERDILAVV